MAQRRQIQSEIYRKLDSLTPIYSFEANVLILVIRARSLKGHVLRTRCDYVANFEPTACKYASTS